MFKFAIKNLLTKKIQSILIIFSIMISAGVAVLAFNVSKQVNDGIVSNAQYYSAIIGPSGSKTQLIMNTMYFTDDVVGTIPYEAVTDLAQDMRVKKVIPYAMADSYNGFKIVGTSTDYISGIKLKSGNYFNNTGDFTITVGYNVAKLCELKVGEEVYTSHSATEEHHIPFTVSGILEKTNSVFDNIVFTSIQSIWEVHEHEEEHEEHEEHDHEELNHMVCAVLVNTTNPITATTLVNDYNGKVYTDEENKTYSLQAVEPMEVVRGILQDVDNTRFIVYALCAVILVMNLLVISIITILNMYHSSKEIKLMRLIGISMNKVNQVYLVQNGLLGLISILLAFGISRLGLLFMSDYCLSMGVVLNYGSIYFVEGIILIGVFLISIIPTIIWTNVIAMKDGLK